MERRNRSIKALTELKYLHSLDDPKRAEKLVFWVNTYLTPNGFSDFDLERHHLQELFELFYANLNFLKSYRNTTREELLITQKMRKFVENS